MGKKVDLKSDLRKAILGDNEDTKTNHLHKGDVLLHKKGNYYIILEMNVMHSETDEKMVVYRNIETGDIWVRPLKTFTKDRFMVIFNKSDIEQ